MFIQQLNGSWELRKVGGDEIIKARVPGCVHTDLMRAKIIEDPFHGDNEYKVAWVHETDWEYSRTFKADSALFDSDKVYLECDGLDAIADLTLNGHFLGHVENMYTQYRFDVTDKLTPAENNIQIRFTSPVNNVKPLLEKEPLISPGDSIPGSIYMRKSPSQWGWDWGPKIPTSGIWRPIRLAAYKIGRIEDLWIRQNHRSGGQVTLNIETAIEKFRRASCRVVIRVTHPDGKVEEREIKSVSSSAKCSINIDKPKLWWPNGYGEQPLYTVEAILISGDEELHTLTRRIGLRSLKLDLKKDEYGRRFTFVVNNVSIFAKGADWVPADQFPSRITDEHYRHLISSATKANMNMLRVWGGGIYEDDRFYDLCDEYGILVWQDFMFACGHYPCDKVFLENVRREAEYNIIRLRNHASLALWCGNNEMEWFLSGGWGGDKNEKMRKQYARIFHDFFPPIVSKLDPSRCYWPSSPSNGLQKPFDDSNGQHAGDGHYWDVWHGRKPFTAYRDYYFRFMSEFGFESLPAFDTVKSFCDSDDLNITSHIMECHQKNSAGNGLILYYLAQTFRFPKSFEMMCYVSQLLQAEAMRYGVEHWRRNRGRCMGTLYWQFNDCWPVCSWASMDYFGRWKALQYFAKRFYSPILLSVAEDGARAGIHVTNDSTKAAKIEVRWSLEKLDGTILRKSKIKTRIEGEADKLLADLDFTDELQGDAVRETVLVSELLVNGKHAGITVTPFVPTKHVELLPAKIDTQVKSDESGYFIELTSNTTARFVCLNIPRHDVLFSNNYFDLPAGRTVTVRVESDVDENALPKLKVYSLRDTY